MVFSLSDFDNLQFSSNLGNTSPVFPTDSGESQSNLPSPTEATGEPATAQDSSSLAVPALDPALVPCSPLAPNQTTNPMLHSEDLTQLAHHLALQKSLSKPNANELMSFSKVFLSMDPPIHLFLRYQHSNLWENNLFGSRQHNSP